MYREAGGTNWNRVTTGSSFWFFQITTGVIRVFFFLFWSLSAQTPDKSYSSNSWVCWLHGQTWENEDSCFPRRLSFGYPILGRNAFSTVIYFFH